jgi:hypothetical protein
MVAGGYQEEAFWEQVMSEGELESSLSVLRFCCSCGRSEAISPIPQWIGPQPPRPDNEPVLLLCYECLGRQRHAAYIRHIEQEREVEQERARHRKSVLRQLRQGSADGSADASE